MCTIFMLKNVQQIPLALLVPKYANRRTDNIYAGVDEAAIILHSPAHGPSRARVQLGHSEYSNAC